MSMDLVPIEPIQPPDVRRPAKLTSLPHWVEARCASLKKDIQPDETGRYREVPTLPANLILRGEQKALVESHVRKLDVIFEMTPAESDRFAQQTLTTVSKMLAVLPSREAGELAAEAKGEAYIAALDDIPSWAVQEAMRRWYRSECGDKYDYRWQPGPSTLREISQIELYRVRAIRRKLCDVLAAEPPVEFGEDHRAAMRAKLKAIGVGGTVE